MLFDKNTSFLDLVLLVTAALRIIVIILLLRCNFTISHFMSLDY